MPSDKKLLGAFGEDAACAYQKRRGYKIIGRNYLCRLGEIDIIAKNRKFVVFAEVKLRKNDAYGRAAEFVTQAKQHRVILAAERWLLQNPTELQPRFDVIEVYAPQGLDTKKPEIHHLEDAFSI